MPYEASTIYKQCLPLAAVNDLGRKSPKAVSS
jgi:hypothetical protein